MREAVQDLVDILSKETDNLSEAAYDALVVVCNILEKEERSIAFVDDGVSFKIEDEWD